MKSVKKNMLFVLVAALSFTGCHAVKNLMRDNVYLDLKDKKIPKLIKEYGAATGAQAKRLEDGIDNLFKKLYDKNPDSYRQAAIKKSENNWLKVRAQNRSAMGRALPPLPAQPAAPAGRAQLPLPPLPAQPAGGLYPQLPPRPAQPAGPQATTTTGASAGAAAQAAGQEEPGVTIQVASDKYLQDKAAQQAADKALADAEWEEGQDEIVPEAEPIAPMYGPEPALIGPEQAPADSRPLNKKILEAIDQLNEYSVELKNIQNSTVMKNQIDMFLAESEYLLNLINDKALLNELAALRKKIAAGQSWGTWLASFVATQEPKINTDWDAAQKFMIKAIKSARGFLKKQGE